MISTSEAQPCVDGSELLSHAETEANRSAAPSSIGSSSMPSADNGTNFAHSYSFETEAYIHSNHPTPKVLPNNLPEPAATEEAGLRAAMVKNFRRSATTATPLDRTELLKEAMSDCSEGGTLQTSMPMYSVYCVQWTCIFHLAFALTSLNKFAGCLSMMLHDRKCEGQHFRFTPLEMRRGPSGPWAALEGPGVSDFGLMYQRCGIGGANMSRDGSSMLASFYEPVGINGFWLQTGHQQDVAMDPVRFVVEGSLDGASWALCGASRLMAVPSLSDVALIGWQAAFHNTTLERGAVEVFGLELPWQFALDHVLVMLSHFVCNLSAFVLLYLHRPLQAHSMILKSHFMCAGLYSVSAAAYLLQGNMSVAAIPTVYALLFFGISYAFRSQDSMIRFHQNAMAGFLIAYIVQYLVIFSSAEGTQAVFNGYRKILPLDVKTAFITSSIFFSVYLWAKIGLARSIAEARNVIASDEQEYNMVFTNLTASPSFADALNKIDTLVCKAWGHLQPGILRQRDGLPRSRHARPIFSFERIFAQAGVAEPLLWSKVKAWALRSGGMFPLHDPESGTASCDSCEANQTRSDVFERWDRIVGDAELMRRVKWPTVKSEKRVVEKVYRCYAGDVSRLFDCCRSEGFERALVTIGTREKYVDAVAPCARL
jgi:hypothetical protein